MSKIRPFYNVSLLPHRGHHAKLKTVKDSQGLNVIIRTDADALNCASLAAAKHGLELTVEEGRDVVEVNPASQPFRMSAL